MFKTILVSKPAFAVAYFDGMRSPLVKAISALGYDDDPAKMLDFRLINEERVNRFNKLPAEKQDKAMSKLLVRIEELISALRTLKEGDMVEIRRNEESKSILFDYAIRVIIEIDGREESVAVHTSTHVPYMTPLSFKSWAGVAAQAEADGKYVVRTGTDFQYLRARFNKKEGNAITFTHLNQVGKSKKAPTPWFKPIAKLSPVTAETELLQKTVESAVTWVNPKYLSRIDNFSYAFLYLQVEDVRKLKLFKHQIFRCVKLDAEGFVIDEHFYIDNGNGGMLDLVTGKSVTVKEAKDNCRLHTYTMAYATSTPGQEKKQEVTLICDNLPGFNARAHVNFMTHGAYDIFTRHFAGVDFSSKQKAMAQAATRMSQFKAPMIDGKPMHVFAVILDKIHDLAGHEFMDGLGWISAEYAAEFYSDEHFEVLPSAVDGAGMQCRPNHVSKGFFHVRPRAHILHDLCEQLNCRFEFVFQDGGTIQKDQEDIETRILDGEGTGTRFDRRKDGQTVCMVVCEHRCDPKDGHEYTKAELLKQLSVAEDLNVFKTVCDFTIPMTGLGVMDIAHEKADVEDEANTSNQLLDSALWRNLKETLDFCSSEAKKFVLGKLINLMSDKERTPHCSEINADLGQLASSVFPGWELKCWAPSFQSKADKTLEGISNKIAKLAVATDGLYAKLIPDLTHLTKNLDGTKNLSVLHYDEKAGVCEVFAPGLEDCGIRDAVLLKYPKQGHDEFLRARIVYREELVARIAKFYDECEISFETYRRLRHEIRVLQGGIFMVPAIASLMNLLAGMDFDGDAAMAYTKEELVRLFDGIRACASVICGSEEEMKKVSK